MKRTLAGKGGVRQPRALTTEHGNQQLIKKRGADFRGSGNTAKKKKATLSAMIKNGPSKRPPTGYRGGVKTKSLQVRLREKSKKKKKKKIRTRGVSCLVLAEVSKREGKQVGEDDNALTEGETG